MELWLIYALIGSFLFGIVFFIPKIIAEKNLNKRHISYYSAIVYLFISFIYLMFTSRNFELGILFGLLLILRMILAFEKDFARINGLKYLDASIFLPISRILQVFFAFFIGMIFFGEFLGFYEILALLLGFVIVYLLSGKKELSNQKDVKKGFLFLLLTNFLLMGTSTINKVVTDFGFDLGTYLFYSSIVGIIYMYFTKKKEVKNGLENVKLEWFYGFLKGFIGFFAFLFFLKALEIGDFALVQLINSFSLFVGVFLSVWIFKEKMTLRKYLALILLGVVLFLLVL